ncbi:hypothetical protein [uncultured Ruthenibacterium sp.]|uniref:hypothetical protein n=1 Tax=uncultured Ruthenibacterium sp. TaxID=1905347 RepID=UPI00349E6CAC
MRRFFCIVCLFALLAGCAPEPLSQQTGSPEYTAPYVRADGALVLKELPTVGSATTALTDHGFFDTVYIPESGASILTFYDFETKKQRVVCDAPGCTHTDETCLACVHGAFWRIGDWLYFFGDVDPDDSSQGTLVERRDLNGENPEKLGIIGGEWIFSAGCFTDGTSLFTYDGSDFVCIELPSCHVTIIERYRQDQPVSYESEMTKISPNGQVYYLGRDPDTKGYPGFQLAKDGNTIYSVDPLNGWIYTYDVSTGQSRVLSREMNQYIWTWERPIGWDDQGRENRWETTSCVQGWNGTLIDGALLIDLHGLSIDDRDTELRVAVNLEDGSVRTCTLSDFWMDKSHPIRILQTTDYGLLVVPYSNAHEQVDMDMNGVFYQRTTYGETIYALISTQDFLNNIPNYQILESLSSQEGSV